MVQHSSPFFPLANWMNVWDWRKFLHQIMKSPLSKFTGWEVQPYGALCVFLLTRGCGNELQESSQRGIWVRNTNLKRASVVMGPVGNSMRVWRTLYIVGLALMPPELNISPINFPWQSLYPAKHHHRQHSSSASAVLFTVHAGGGRVGGINVGVLALSSCVFSGQEQLLKCYPTILSKHRVFHNWLSCSMFCFTVACDLDINFESPCLIF